MKQPKILSTDAVAVGLESPGWTDNGNLLILWQTEHTTSYTDILNVVRFVLDQNKNLRLRKWE